MAEIGQFHRIFQRWARRVRGRMLLGRVLSGVCLGVLAGAAGAALLWWFRLGPQRPWAFALAGVGGLVGALVAMRRRWSDGDVALYLDAKLESREAISTAVELREQAERPDSARAVVVKQAAKALEAGDPKLVRPPLLKRWHTVMPLGAAAATWLCLIPLRPLPPPAPEPPGSELVKTANLKGLDKITSLEKLDARDAAQRERLNKIAEEAKRLREDLKNGLEKREAQARIAKLRDDIAAERQNFHDEKNRAGLEAAIAKLNKNPLTKDAAKALGDGDLVEFDKEMQKLANKAEKEDREAAKEALKEAEKAAREKGSKGLAESLKEQQKQFEQREQQGKALRELAQSLKDQGKLSEQAQKDLEEFGESGSPEARKRLSESLEKALEGLSEEERKRLAENLKKRMQSQDPNQGLDPMTKKQIDDMSKKLDTPEGREQLKQMLKELAKQDPGDEAKRQQGLEDADRGGAEAQKQLGAPMPMEGPGAPGDKNGKDGKDGKDPSNGKQAGGTGSHHDKGKGDHKGATQPLDSKELRSKANAKLNPGAPMQGSTMGRAPSRPGETANQRGTGALGEAAPSEVGGVEHSEVPEEYREQVGRYFQP